MTFNFAPQDDLELLYSRFISFSCCKKAFIRVLFIKTSVTLKSREELGSLSIMKSTVCLHLYTLKHR